MQADAPNGASGDLATAGLPSSRVIVEGFFGKQQQIPSAAGSLTTPIQAYFGGHDTFNVSIGTGFAATVELWTDVRGMEAIINACQSVLVRARIAMEDAGGSLDARETDLFALLTDEDVPF